MRVEPIRDKQLINRTAEALSRDTSEAGTRRYLMYLTGIYLGRRVSDYRQMRVRDLLGREKLVIREKKTGKEVELFIPKTLRTVYKERLSGRDPDEYLFASNRREKITGDKKPVCYRTLLRDSKEIQRIMGLPDGYNIGILEEEVATHSSINAWEIPWTGEPGGLQPMGLQRIGHELMTKQQVLPAAISLGSVQTE